MATAKSISEDDLLSLNPQAFWRLAEIRSEQECWPWIGARTEKGYGRFRLGGQTHKAHRVAFAIGKNTGLPGVVMVCHRCDNAGCVNPAHLFIGLALDNNRDARRKGRGVSPLSELNGKCKLTDAQVKHVLNSKATGAMMARELRVSESLISMIRSRRRRKMVGGAGLEPATPAM